MVVHDLNVVRVTAFPAKANTVLIVDTNAELAVTVPRELLKLISWRNSKVTEGFCGVQNQQLSKGGSLKRPCELAARATKESLRLRIAEPPDHEAILTHRVNIINERIGLPGLVQFSN